MTDTQNNVAVLATVREAMDHASADTVFGRPIDHDGVTVLPVARLSGGGGGGSGTGPEIDDHQPAGSGGGLGLSARPVGVFVIRDGQVSWRPAIDVNKVILGGQIVAVVALIVLRSVLKWRRRAETPALD